MVRLSTSGRQVLLMSRRLFHCLEQAVFLLDYQGSVLCVLGFPLDGRLGSVEPLCRDVLETATTRFRFRRYEYPCSRLSGESVSSRNRAEGTGIAKVEMEKSALKAQNRELYYVLQDVEAGLATSEQVKAVLDKFTTNPDRQNEASGRG